jgi:aminopeptidase N
MIKCIYLAWLPLLLLSCHTTKKIELTPLPELTITADTSKRSSENPAKEIYRGSNTRLSDILHTKLEVNFDWTNCRMNGKATLKVRPYCYATDQLFLDARGMDIKSLEVFDVAFVTEKKKDDSKTGEQVEVWHKITASSYNYEHDSLKIRLGKTFTNEQFYYVVIDYVAKPNELKTRGSNAITDDKGLYFINPTGENLFRMPQIWTQGETQASSAWFPTIDSPNEKMTQEILMTVQDRFTTLSNGSLVGSTKNADGTRTDHWKLEQPHSPYLAMMAVGEFKKVTGAPWNGKEISYYVEKSYEPHAAAIFGDTREMIDFYSGVLGVPYPWSKYSQIAVRDYVSGAMENTSATLHGDFMVYQTTREMLDGKRANSVIAHELFHQWFGDLVTAESWSNLPLNESFATYGQYLWEEFKEGRETADYHHWQSRQGYFQADKEVDLIRFNYQDKEDMFDLFSYNKGGQVLHMLRKAVGNVAFFASLKNYLETNKYKSGEIHNLRLAFEETTGRDMNWFFNQWFLNKGRPKLKVSKKYDAAAGMVELTVEQVQDFKVAPLYTLPVEIDVYVNNKSERTSIVIDEPRQVFRIRTSGAPSLVNFDAERQLLCDLEYQKSDDEYVFQYRNAPLFEDRYEALHALQEKINDEPVFRLFTEVAANDKFYAIRDYAIGRLEKVKEDKALQIKPILIQVFNTDQKSTTRAKALSVLNNRFIHDPDILALNERALAEESYAICAEALETMGKVNPKMALEKAKMFEKEQGKDILFAVANLYSNHGSDNQIRFFHEGLFYINGFDQMPFLAAYAKTARRCLSGEYAIQAALDFESIGKGANKYIKFSALKGLKDIASAWEAREATARTNLENARKEGKNVAELEKQLASATETKDILNKMYNRSK